MSGTRGSLGIPTMRLRTVEGEPSWWSPMLEGVIPVDRADPLAEQVRHFAAVIRGAAEPLVSGRDGLATLRVTEAVTQSAASGEVVRLPDAGG